MISKPRKLLSLVIVLAMVATAFAALPTMGAGISGAIHTSDSTGLDVNDNLYDHKEDVYLTGGPGPGSPTGAAGLPDGWWYFQVTDPSGKNLLSSDSIYSRQFRTWQGIPVEYKAEYPAGYLDGLKNGQLTKALNDLVEHEWTYNYEVQNEDGDYAICIQLYPFDGSPNGGGVYKVWAIMQDYYDDSKDVFGFIPSYSKTDNFKVKLNGNGHDLPEPTYLTVNKYYDVNANGMVDTGESSMSWLFLVTDPYSVTNEMWSSFTIDLTGDFIASKGDDITYTIEEGTPTTGTWYMTGLVINGVSQSTFGTSVSVTISEGTNVTVDFLNVAFGYKPSTGRTPGFWQGPNGQALIDQDVLDYLNGLVPFQEDQDFYPEDLPFDDAEEVGDFLVGHDASKYASIPEFKLAKFYLAMQLNVYTEQLNGDLAFWWNGDLISINDFLAYLDDEFPWDEWSDTTILAYKDQLDDMCNNLVYYTWPTPPTIDDFYFP